MDGEPAHSPTAMDTLVVARAIYLTVPAVGDTSSLNPATVRTGDCEGAPSDTIGGPYRGFDARWQGSQSSARGLIYTELGPLQMRCSRDAVGCSCDEDASRLVNAGLVDSLPRRAPSAIMTTNIGPEGRQITIARTKRVAT